MVKNRPTPRPNRTKHSYSISLRPDLMERIRRACQEQPYRISLTSFFEQAVKRELARMEPEAIESR